MLLSSPVLVVYAELLLIIQFIYSLEFPDLPSYIQGVNLREVIGQQAFGENHFKDIVAKSLYTLMFWITLRQYVMERRQRPPSSTPTIEDAVQESFRITIGTHHGDGGGLIRFSWATGDELGINILYPKGF